MRLKNEKDMETLVHYLKKRILRIILFPLRLNSVKNNRVFMHNDLAYNYSGNPKYVTEYLLDKYPKKFDIVVSTKYPERYGWLKQRGINVVKFNSFEYFYYAITARVFLTNSGGFSYIPMRKSQIVINTHHGGGAYKKIGRFVYGDTAIFRKDLLLSANSTTVFLSTCKKFTEVVSNSILIPKDIFWEIGMPRNDCLLHYRLEDTNTIKNKLGLKSGEKLVLYAPTYRKPDEDHFKDSIAISYGIDCDRVCKALKNRFGGDWIFGFRFHPCVVNRDELPSKSAIDLSDYEEMQELLIAADVMINDFSSSMWDFMLTKKPSFTFAVDMDQYIENTKVETPVEKWPFPKARNNDELEKAILEFDADEYERACEQHYKDLGGCETGNATQLVGEYIYEKCFN